jgi:hypothetical protein
VPSMSATLLLTSSPSKSLYMTRSSRALHYEVAVLCSTVLCMQELDAAGLLATPANPSPSPFTWQLLGKLQYLQAVIREGLRLFSPAANGSFRMNTAAELQLKPGLVIPKVRGSMLMWCFLRGSTLNALSGWWPLCVCRSSSGCFVPSCSR